MGTVAFGAGFYRVRVWKGLWESKNGKLLQCTNEVLGGPKGKRDFEMSYNTAIDRQKGRFRPPNVVRGTVGSPTIAKRDCKTSCEYAKRDFLVLQMLFVGRFGPAKWAKGTCGAMSTTGGKIEDER